MMRTGVPGLLVGLFSFAILVLASVLLRRWIVGNVRVERPRTLTLVLAVLTACGPIGRSLVGLGFSDRWGWLEAVGLLYGLALLAALPFLYLFSFIVDRRVEPERRETFAKIGGGAIVAASATPLVLGVVRTRFEAEVIEVPIKLPKLPRALDGFTIVQVSDIHIGAYLGERELRYAEDLVAGCRPDLVVMTGDLVHLRPRYLPEGCDWVRRLGTRARHGVLSILGNHEYYVGRHDVLTAFQRAGLDLLINESRVIAGLGFAGVDDEYSKRAGFGPDVPRALAKLRDDVPRILLAHQPTTFTDATGLVDLQLSGHTHGGQIAPFGPLVASAMFRGRCAGLYRSGGSTLYVNRGFGTSGPPSRVAVRPEITKIVLLAG